MASYEFKNGKYSVRFRFINVEGREINKRLSGFKTKKQAEQAYMQFIFSQPKHEKRSQENLTAIQKTFESFYHEYLEFKISRVKVSTYYDIVKIFPRHILPFFGHMKLKEITKHVVLQWQNSLDKQNYTYKYKSNLRAFLFNYFKYLNTYHDIPNVVAKVDGFVKTKTKVEQQIWTLDQFKKFIAVTQEPYTTFFKTLYYLGLRLGECLALSPHDIDFDKNTVNINKNLTEKVKGKPFEIVAPKNISSYRVLEMPKQLASSLNNYIKQFNPTTFLFGDEKPFATTSLRRIYAQYLEISKVPKIRMHDFRHSHASLLIELGANIVLIAKRLGHTNIEMTLNTYSHLMPNSEKELIEKIEQIY